jgi:hypothetical protein
MFGRETRARRRCAGLAGLLALWIAAPATGDSVEDATARACLSIGGVTAFAPRGQLYVEITSTCTDTDFEREDPILAYVEVLIGDLPPLGQDVRVHRGEQRRHQTLVFRNLQLATGQLVLVRLVRFGEILGLRSLKVP